MSTNNKKRYTIEFDVNKASLNQLKTTLQEIQKMSVGDFRLQSPQGFNSLEEAAKELAKIQKQASEVEKVLERAFNPKLGVANLTKFTEGIKKIGVDDLTRGWAQLGAVGESATRHLATGLVATNTELKQSHKLLDEMAVSFKNTVKWGLSSAVFNTMTNSLQASWNYAKNLNKSLTDIRIVSEQSAAQMEKFAVQASKAAKSLGATTLDYSNAALLYYQQGDSPEEVAQKAELTVKMANVLGTSAAEVSNYMTSIWNNFSEGGDNLEYYADVLTKLGAATASSAEEISTGLEKFASVAKTVDLSYEYATAALTTITATTRQSADIVGTALKTLFARIQDLELGETLDDGTTLGKYSEALEKVGISLKGQDGQIRSMDALLSDMGDKWQTLSKNQKIALAQTVAGTRQYTQLVALMDNWDVMEENIQLAREATGSLQEQQDKYMESTEAHLNKLTASTERLMDALIDDEGMNGLIDALTSVTDLLANFVEGIGGGTSAMLMLGSIGTKVFNKHIAEGLAVTVSNLRTGAKAAEELHTAFTNLSSFEYFANKSDTQVPGILGKFESVKSMMSNEDIKRVNEYMQVLSDFENQEKRAWSEKVHAANLLKDFNMQVENPLDANDIFDLKDFDTQIKEKAKVASSAVLDFKKSIDSLYEDNGERDLTKVIGNFEKAKDKMQDFAQSYGNAFEQEQAEGIEVNTRKLESFIDKLRELERQKDSLADEDFENSLKDITQGENAKLYKTMYDFAQGSAGGLTTVQKKGAYIFANLGAEGKKAYEQLEAESKKAINGMMGDLDKFFNKLKDSREIEKFVTALSGIGELASAFITLGNLDDIWNDENLSGWEKFLQITLNITSVLPLVIMGLKNIATGASEIINFFRGFLHTVSFGKIALENKALEESTEQANKAAKDLNKTMSTEMAAATTARIANDKAIIASNNAVIASNKARAASEEGDLFDDLLATDPNDMVGPMGGKAGDMPDLAGDILDAMDGDKTDDFAKELFSDLFDEAGEEIAEQGLKKVLKEGTEEGLEQGLKGAVKNTGLFAGLKTKIAGLFSGASGAGGATVLGMGLGKLALVAGGAAAAIGAVALVVAALTKEQREAEKKAKELAEAVEQTKKAYEGAAAAAKSFKTEIQGYSDAITSLEKMVKGSNEWRLQLVEINEQAMELLQKYPQLAAYAERQNGYITFSQEGLDTLASRQASSAVALQNSYFRAQAEQLQFELDQLEKKAVKAIDFSKLKIPVEVTEIEPGEAFDFSSRATLESDVKKRELYTLTTNDAERVVRAFKNNEDLLVNGSNEDIIKLLKKYSIDLTKYTTESQNAFIDGLRDKASDISQFTLSLDEYTQKIGEYTRELANPDNTPEGSTYADYNAIYNKIKEEKKEEWLDDNPWHDKEDSKEIIDAYAEYIMGYDTKRKDLYYDSADDGDKKWHKQDYFEIGPDKDNLNKVTYEEARKIIADAYAEEYLNSDAGKKEIEKKSITTTRDNNKEYAEDVFSDWNKTIATEYENGKYRDYILDPKDGDIFWDTKDYLEYKNKIKEEIENIRDPYGLVNEPNWEAFLNDQEILQLGPQITVRGQTATIPVNGEDDVKRILEELLKVMQEHDISGISPQVDTDANGVPFQIRIDWKDPGTLEALLEQLKAQGIEINNFSQYVDDLFNERDITGLYTIDQIKFYNEALKRMSTDSSSNWKYYEKTVNNGDTLLNSEAALADARSLTPEEKKKREAAALEEEYNRLIKENAESLGVSVQAYEAYADQIKEDNTELQKYNRTLREQNALAIEAAKRHFEFANKLNTLNEAVKDGDDFLKKWGKAAGENPLNELDPNQMEQVGKVVQAMQEMFGEEVSVDWVQDNIEDVIKLANGDMDAYARLQDKYSDLQVKEMSIELDATSKEKFENELNTFLDDIPDDLQIGAQISWDEKKGTNAFLQELGLLVAAGKIKGKELEEAFGAKGFKVTWETKTVPTNNIGKILSDWGITTPFTHKTFQVPRLEFVDVNKTTYTPSVPPTTGGGSSSKPSKVQETEDEFDRYYKVDTELKKIANSLEEVQRTTDRSTGSTWVENLTNQFSLLNDKISTTKEKLKIAEGELAELQGKLSAEGAVFGSDGTLLNYKEVYYKAYNDLRAAEDHMNSLSTSAAQDKYRDTYEAKKEKYEEVKELVERYREVFTELIPGLKLDIKEAIDEQTQIKIDIFTAEIKVRLEMADFDRDWREFKRKVIDQIEEDDILGNAKADLGLFDIYYNEEGKGTIQRLTEQVKRDLEQLQQFESGQDMSIYKDFSATQLEDMKSHIESLMQEMESLYDLQEQIRESYLDMMDEANEKFEEQVSLYQQVTSLIEHDMNLISLIYGEDAYTELGQYFDQLHSNNLQSLDMLRQQATFWQDEMNKHDVGSDEWEKAKENWLAAVDELTAKTEESINTVKERFTNAIEAIFQKLNDEVTNGKGLEYLSKEWELINQNSDKYLDNMNAIYAIQKLQNKYQEAIDSNDGLKAQRELKTIMNEELKALREKDKLTQYDVDRAELRYQIALKQIALEEAQQNKSKMRLRRDSQGNYTYQYTADEEQVSKLEGEMSDLYQQLYNLDANEYKNNLNELYNVWVQFQEDMKAAEAINDEEEKQARKLLLTEQYGQLINDIVARDEELKKNLHESTMSGLLDLYNTNAENYNNMTAEQQQILDSFLTDQTDLTGAAYNNLFTLYEDCVSQFRGMTDAQKDILVSSMLPQWNSTLAEMMAKINGEGGFAEVCKNAFKELDDANEEYRKGLKEVETSAGTSFDAIKGGYDKNTEAVKALIKENDVLIQSYKDQLEEIAKVIAEMDKIIEKYGDAAEAARKYGEEAYKAWLKAQGKNADELEEGANKLLNPDPEPTPQPTPTPQPEKPKEITKGGKVRAGSGAMIYDYAGDTSGETQYYRSDPNYTVLRIDGNWVQVRHHKLSSGITGWFKKGDLTALNTGGYTGNWHGDGRLALLHQKELVLNAQDTKNMLNAINIVRAITDNLGASLLNRMGNIAANAGAEIMGNSDGLTQTVHIDAQFPSVTSSSEIEDALNNLVNRAAQHITKN